MLIPSIKQAHASFTALPCLQICCLQCLQWSPPPKQDFYILPDKKAFCGWWISKGRDPIPDDAVIPVLTAMQGHLESGRLWEKHIDKILCHDLQLQLTVHKPCLYSGTIDLQQSGVSSSNVRSMTLQLLSPKHTSQPKSPMDAKLRMPMWHQGLIHMYSDLNILQLCYFIKMSVATWISKILQPYFKDWLEIPSTPFPTPFPTPIGRIHFSNASTASIKYWCSSPKVIGALKKSHGLKYINITARQLVNLSDLWPLVVLTLHNPPSNVPRLVLPLWMSTFVQSRVSFILLAAIINDWIYFWRTEAVMSLPKHPMPKISSTPHDIMLANQPLDDDPTCTHSYMDSSLDNCLLTRRSLAGSLMCLAGGPIAYKAIYQPTIAGSSTDTEFCQASDTGRMALYVHSIIYDFGVLQEAATILYKDNGGATAMANSGKPTPTPRSRHMIDIKFYAIQEWVERDLMVLERKHGRWTHQAPHPRSILSPSQFYNGLCSLNVLSQIQRGCKNLHCPWFNNSGSRFQIQTSCCLLLLLLQNNHIMEQSRTVDVPDAFVYCLFRYKLITGTWGVIDTYDSSVPSRSSLPLTYTADRYNDILWSDNFSNLCSCTSAPWSFGSQ